MLRNRKLDASSVEGFVYFLYACLSGHLFHIMFMQLIGQTIHFSLTLFFRVLYCSELAQKRQL